MYGVVFRQNYRNHYKCQLVNIYRKNIMGLNKFTRLFLLIVICLAAVIVGNYMIRSHPKRKESTQAKTIYLVETGQPRTSAQFEGNLAQFEGDGIGVTQLEASSETTYKLDTRNAIPEKQLSTVSTTSPRAIHFNLLTESNTVELLLPDRSLGITERVNLPESGSDMYISVRSTARNHETRLALNLATWMQTVDPLQVHIFTNNDSDPWIQTINDRGYSVSVSVECEDSRGRSALCCKLGLEYQAYYLARKMKQKNYRWFCHIDDDIYVNIAQLVRLLKSYDPVKEKLYLGHFPASLWENKKIFKKDCKKLKIENLQYFPEQKGDTFVYATGAVYCISSSLMDLVEKYFSGSNFPTTCNKLQKPEDLTIGIVIDAVLGYNLSEVPAMMSEVEDQTKIDRRKLSKMVTVGYRMWTSNDHVIYKLNKNNRVAMPDSPFTEEEDPTGFLSYHCLLYPRTLWCLAKRG